MMMIIMMMMMMRAFRYGMSDRETEGPSFSLHDRFERDRSASLLGPSRRVAERTFYFEPMRTDFWSDRSVCFFL